jgi:hypothetical protein
MGARVGGFVVVVEQASGADWLVLGVGTEEEAIGNRGGDAG